MGEQASIIARRSPIMVKMPHRAQTTRLMLTLPVEARTPVGDTKIPGPMMQPTMTPHPFRRLISALSFMPSPSSSASSLGLDMAMTSMVSCPLEPMSPITEMGMLAGELRSDPTKPSYHTTCPLSLCL